MIFLLVAVGADLTSHCTLRGCRSLRVQALLVSKHTFFSLKQKNPLQRKWELLFDYALVAFFSRARHNMICQATIFKLPLIYFIFISDRGQVIWILILGGDVWGVEHLGVHCGAAIATSSHALHINLKAFAVPSFSRGIWWKLKYEGCRPLYTAVFLFPLFKFLIPLFPLLRIYTPAKFQGSRKAAPPIIIKWCFWQVRLSERRKHQAGRWRQFLHCRVTVLPMFVLWDGT